jgi:hypothetical protein
VTGRRAVDHDDSHDRLLYPIILKGAQNLGDDVTGERMGGPMKAGPSPAASIT